MEDCVDPFTPYNADCLLELLYLGVSPTYSKRGIGITLCKVSIEIATLLFNGQNVKTSLDGKALRLEPRPQIVTAIFTGLESKRIGRRLNFDILKTISYENLYYNGRSYASFIGKENTYCTLECKNLQ